MNLQQDVDTQVTQRCSPLGCLNAKNEEIDEMIKEAPGPINFTVFLTMFGEKLKGEGAPGKLAGLVGTHTITNIPSHMGRPPSSQDLHHHSRRDPSETPCRPQMGAAQGKAGGTDCHAAVCRAWGVGQSKDASHATAKR